MTQSAITPRPVLVDRRAFLSMAGAAWAVSLSPAAAAVLSRTDAVFASAFRAGDGAYGIATVSEEGEVIDRHVLPDRAHGLAHSAVSGHTVAFARRPGTFAMILDTAVRDEPVVITASEGRHFFGHGCFSADGRLLYATENDFAGNRGMIGFYDGTDGYRRMGEFPTYGIGPHDMTLSPDGRLLVVANGGIETHPDFGRTKLNLDHMEPSLVLIETATGRLVERHVMPPHLRQLSTRHVDIDAGGRIWFACQYEGPRNARPPVAGAFAPGEDIKFLDLPEEAAAALANYVGAIAVHRAEGLVGLASPKGGAVVTVDARTGTFVKLERLADAAGIAPAKRPGFAVSSYDGRFAERTSPIAWDQHIIRTRPT
ncbi:hypothetical protein ASG39_09020 [Rhizobium sp. Leaf371]|uniref:DUF1513 domain-containing protein n=1 Tax=Rhizobium sp. Leaf371 TaxID=1736355 RepID=UPI0007129570|nr:DUF1513 domain-containing protein [Rhizobium sp. Leaf371]KQS65370.1 hypothetical protein ASG39_09020 [Rhizobium sp. Leaf371]